MDVKTVSVLPTTNSIAKSELNQSQGKVKVTEVPDVKTPLFYQEPFTQQPILSP